MLSGVVSALSPFLSLGARTPCRSRGWTAFTAYGLEMRARVRAANPGAPAMQIEKVRTASDPVLVVKVLHLLLSFQRCAAVRCFIGELC